MDPLDTRLTLGRFLADVATRHGDRCAIHFEGRTTAYAEVEREARLLARALIGAGVVKGARVALLMSNRPEWIVSCFAVGLVGGVLVPVNTFATGAELQYVLRHSDASLLLMQPGLLKHRYLDDLLRDHASVARGVAGRLRCNELPQLRRIACLGIDEPRGGVETWGQLLAHEDGVTDELLDAASAEVEPADDGILIYTSGTTSLPKGVLHTHRAAVLQAWRFADFMCFDAEDRVYTTYPFFWTAGIAMSLGGTFAAGGRLLLQEAFEAGAALDLIEVQRATAVHAWPHQMKALGEHPSASRRDLSALRKIDISSPLAAIAGIEQDEYGTGASYGSSETFTISSGIAADSPLALRRATHGKPWPGNVIRIVDPHTGEKLPAGVEGEIALKGATFMRGYYKLPPECYLDEDGFFRSQDAGSLDADGYLHWSGRLSNIIKQGGANVSPIEIEDALEAHPGVKLGVALGIEHPSLGEAVVLCVVPTDGTILEEAEVREFLKARLAAYKLPRKVLAFAASDLSYTGNQKVQVGPLREAALARLQAEEVEIDGHRYRKT